jgi:hypothetical protein
VVVWFALAQRDDNADLVAAARDAAGCGELDWRPPRHTSHAQLRWLVWTMDDCLALARSLCRVHLLAKKAGDFDIWRRAVCEWTDTTRKGAHSGPTASPTTLPTTHGLT